MAAAITDPVANASPGVKCTINGSGLTGGGPASVTLAGQGGDETGITTLAATFSGTSVAFVCPDGVRDGLLTVRAVDNSTATVPLQISSQYLFASQFVGQGADTSAFALGELDAILQQASGYCDAYLSRGSESTATLRLLQVVEQSRFRRKTRRVYPRRRPIVSLDAFQYIASPALTVSFEPGDFVVMRDLGFIEQVIWSFGYTYISAIANATMYDAGICKVTYTAGYPYGQYPQALREATKIVAAEICDQRGIRTDGMGGFSRVKEGQVQYDRRGEAFAMPEPAITLLNSLRSYRAG